VIYLFSSINKLPGLESIYIPFSASVIDDRTMDAVLCVGEHCVWPDLEIQISVSVIFCEKIWEE
ncbi:hypothetical protein, partial [Salmonella sp. gx-f5]|uniref:hypothetical protein n=1 Tax=Salmonella sp. gx-f5 TaxID=2582605 RepID=UPI001F314EF2